MRIQARGLKDPKEIIVKSNKRRIVVWPLKLECDVVKICKSKWNVAEIKIKQAAKLAFETKP